VRRGLHVMAESLDELADLVVPLFTDVENKNVDVPEWLDHPYGHDQVKVSVTHTHWCVIALFSLLFHGISLVNSALCSDAA